MSSHLCPALSAQAKRLVAIRFLIYTGFQSSYFIGVIGTLTYADGASVAFTSAAVLLMNIFVILGSFAGGSALDAWGPRRHYFTNVFGVLVVGCVLAFFGHATVAVLAGAALLGCGHIVSCLSFERPRRAQGDQLGAHYAFQRECHRGTYSGRFCSGCGFFACGLSAHDGVCRAVTYSRLGL